MEMDVQGSTSSHSGRGSFLAAPTTSMSGIYFSDDKDGSSPFKSRSMVGMERGISNEKIVDRDFFNSKLNVKL
jgi:hypothetical protein